MKKIYVCIISLICLLLFTGCTTANEKWKESMKEKYSNDQNYVVLFGEVIEINKNYIIIKCEELQEYLDYEDEYCDYIIYSNEIIDLNTGDQIQFKTVPYHFYNGHKLPIVEIYIGDECLLNYKTGKEELFKWINQVQYK